VAAAACLLLALLGSRASSAANLRLNSLELFMTAGWFRRATSGCNGLAGG
jgi:hypothetical protein